MDSKEKFYTSIQEITFLNQKIGNNSGDKALFKSIVLLLSAKLEKYVKDSAQEYVQKLLKLNLTKNDIPWELFVEIIKNEVNTINKVKIENYLTKETYKERSRVLSLIWDDKKILKSLKCAEFSISISNNGTNEFERVYKKIGFPNIINELEDYVLNDDVLDSICSLTSYSIKEKINSIIHMRNNIIHDDATPQITPSDIKLYIEVVKSFVDQIDSKLGNTIESLKK